MPEFAPKLITAPGLTDIMETINVDRMREERAARARQALKKLGLPAMLVTSSPNIRYLNGYLHASHAMLDYILFFADGDPVMFAHAGYYHAQPSYMPWIKNWRLARSWLGGICGPEAMAKEVKLFSNGIKDELKQRGLAKEKLGVSGFDESALDGLHAAGLATVDAYPVLLESSKIKTIDEVACLKTVANMCDAGWLSVIAHARPGMTTAAVADRVRNDLFAIGVENARIAMFFGATPGAVYRGGGRNVRLNYGDIGYMPLCGTAFMGYNACLYRTFVVGRKPNDKEKDMYKKVLDRLYPAIEATKIGNTTADAAKAFDSVTKRKMKDEAEVLTIEFGHGIGIVALPGSPVGYSLPVVNRQWSLEFPQPFEEGMVVAYESLEGEPGYGGVRLEHMVLVTKDGPQILDRFPGDEILVCGA